jgi:hypothetical protein
MGYSLRVTFEGLCAFLPSEEIRPFEPLEQISVFMVDTRKLQPLRRLHKPIVEFRLVDLVIEGENKWDPDAKVRWRLEDMDLFIKIPEVEHPEIIVDCGAQGEEPREGEESDFNWVPRLVNALPPAEASRRRLLYHGGKVDSICLGTDPSDFVAARIHLEHGNLLVDELVRTQNRVTVSQFVPSEEPAPLRQALSLRVALDVEEVNETVFMRAKRFEEDEWIEFELKLGPGADRLQIDFKNLCDDAEGNFSEWGRDDDFELFYRLAGAGEDPGKIVGLPAPVSVRHPPSRTPVAGDGGATFKRCTEVQLSPLDQEQKEYYDRIIRAIYEFDKEEEKEEGERAS